MKGTKILIAAFIITLVIALIVVATKKVQSDKASDATQIALETEIKSLDARLDQARKDLEAAQAANNTDLIEKLNADIAAIIKEKEAKQALIDAEIAKNASLSAEASSRAAEQKRLEEELQKKNTPLGEKIKNWFVGAGETIKNGFNGLPEGWRYGIVAFSVLSVLAVFGFGYRYPKAITEPFRRFGKYVVFDVIGGFFKLFDVRKASKSIEKAAEKDENFVQKEFDEILKEENPAKRGELINKLSQKIFDKNRVVSEAKMNEIRNAFSESVREHIAKFKERVKNTKEFPAMSKLIKERVERSYLLPAEKSKLISEIPGYER
jgi:dGTP triphosphohydrolase